MKEYGDKIKIQCHICDNREGFFMGKQHETYMVGSIPEITYLIMCSGCKCIYWTEEKD